jgi:small subunit ribosomal protein S6
VLDVTHRYEIIYIFASVLEEPAVSEKLVKFHALLGDGAQVQVNHWGKRTLAYRLKRHDTGYYVAAQFEAEATVLPEFERAIRLDEGVLRFLLVRAEGEAPAPLPVETAVAVGVEEEEE